MTAVNWGEVYRSLRDAGYSVGLIAETAGCSRTVVSGVINGSYSGGKDHEPKFSNGCQLIQAVKDEVADGTLPDDTLQRIRQVNPTMGEA